MALGSRTGSRRTATKTPPSTFGTGRNWRAGIRGPSWNDHQGAQVVEIKVDGGVSARLRATSHCTIRSARLSGSEGSSNSGGRWQSWRRRVCTRRLETAGSGVARTGSRHESPRSAPAFVVPLFLGGAQPRPDRVQLREHWLRDGPVPASARLSRYLCRRRVRPARCRSRRRVALRVQVVESSARGDDDGRPGAPGDRRARSTITQADMR
jgi:hypothetical protein